MYPIELILFKLLFMIFTCLKSLGDMTSSSLEEHWLSSSSLEFCLIVIFFNNFSCLLVRALCVGEEGGALGLMSLRSSWVVTLLRTSFGVIVVSSFSYRLVVTKS